MDKTDIRDLSYQQLSAYLISQGEKSFRAEQIFDWLYKKGVTDFVSMHNLPVALIHRLEKDFSFFKIILEKKEISKDKTVKLLFRLHDGEKIESVLIPSSDRQTVCISTQVGCRFGCSFCASCLNGWKRNLTCAEILAQILFIKNIINKGRVTHIVFMGIGEPLDNFDNIMKAIDIINSDKGLMIASRRITISTCGIIPKIKKLADDSRQIELSVSLHSPDDRVRSLLMPVNKKYPLSDLISACREYIKKKQRQVTFEYLLIKDITCTPTAAKKLGRILKGMLCKINLINYNMIKGCNFLPASRKDINVFKEELKRYNLHFTFRRPRGRDIFAACGQLRNNRVFDC